MKTKETEKLEKELTKVFREVKFDHGRPVYGGYKYVTFCNFIKAIMQDYINTNYISRQEHEKKIEEAIDTTLEKVEKEFCKINDWHIENHEAVETSLVSYGDMQNILAHSQEYAKDKFLNSKNEEEESK